MFSNLSHITFANKWVLFLIPVVLVFAGLWWYFLSKKNFPSLKLSATNAFAGMENPFKANLKKFLPRFPREYIHRTGQSMLSKNQPNTAP